MLSFDILSFDMVSFDIVSLDMVSFFMSSAAKAAGANANGETKRCGGESLDRNRTFHCIILLKDVRGALAGANASFIRFAPTRFAVTSFRAQAPTRIGRSIHPTAAGPHGQPCAPPVSAGILPVEDVECR